MVGSGRLEKIVEAALHEMDALGYIFDKPGMRDFVKTYGGEELAELLQRGSDDLLDRVILQVRQGPPGQGVLIHVARGKAGTVYKGKSIASVAEKNAYLRRANIGLVLRRDKAKNTRDEIEAAGDRAEILFVVGRALETEWGEKITIRPYDTARLQLELPGWLAENQFGGGDEDDDADHEP